MLPCMCGSATFTIVMSTTCMIVASMIENVIMPRCGTAGAGLICIEELCREFVEEASGRAHARFRCARASAVARLRRVERIRDGFVAEANHTRQMALVAGVDLDGRAHPGAQRRPRPRVLDGDSHRDALDHLDPVARRVLRRDHGELGPGRLAD